MPASLFRRVRKCVCSEAPCYCRVWDNDLKAEDLQHLDFEDRDGNVLTGNKGSGKILTRDQAKDRRDSETLRTGELAKRKRILDHGVIGQRPAGGRRSANRSLDRRIWELWTEGYSEREIATELRLVDHVLVHRHIKEIMSMNAHLLREPTLAELIKECEPTTLILFFALLRQALERPETIEAALSNARKHPELAPLIDPEPEADPDDQFEAEDADQDRR